MLARRALSPALAAKIRGKLSFSQSQVYGKCGRAWVCALSCRQYAPHRCTFELTPEISSALHYWVHILQNLNPLIVPLKKQWLAILYTDAEGSGVPGSCLSLPWDRPFPIATTAPSAPSWMPGGICELEILAVLLGVTQLARTGFSGPALFFVDNSAAVSALIRDYGSTTVATLLIMAVWEVSSAHSLLPWFDRVSSALNIADAPSRSSSASFPDPSVYSVSGPPPVFLEIVHSLRSLRSFAHPHIPGSPSLGRYA